MAGSCKRLCTQSAQRLHFACSENPTVFHENKKPFLIGYFGLVCYALFDCPKVMITLQSRALTGGPTYIRVNCSFLIRCLIRHFTVMVCSVHLKKATDKNLFEKGEITSKSSRSEITTTSIEPRGLSNKASAAMV